MSFKSPGRVILLSSTGQIVIGQFKEWRFQTLRPVREVRDNFERIVAPDLESDPGSPG